MATSTPEPTSEPTSEPEPSKPEPEFPSLFPEVMHQQAAFLTYGVLIFALFVFCVVLLVMVCLLKKKVKKLMRVYAGGTGNMTYGKANDKGYIA